MYSSTASAFIDVAWKDIKVGDIVRVNEDKFFPADMVIVNSSEQLGGFYVETKNLDGETNLKLKLVSKDLVQYYCDEGSYKNIQGTLNIEQPNNRIYKFDGNFDLASNGGQD